MNIDQKVPYEKCLQVTGNSEIGGHRQEPRHRRTKREKPSGGGGVSTVEAVRQWRPSDFFCAGQPRRETPFTHTDVSRAYFCAPRCRPTYAMIPEEDTRDAQVVVQGGDFLCTSIDHPVQKYIEKMKGIFEVWVTVVGPKDSQQKELVMLNRRVRWARSGITWKADPRHVLGIVRALRVDVNPCRRQNQIRVT